MTSVTAPAPTARADLKIRVLPGLAGVRPLRNGMRVQIQHARSANLKVSDETPHDSA